MKYLTWRFIAGLPRGIAYSVSRRLLLARSRRAQFNGLYRQGGFGGSPSLSGVGSTLENTEVLRQQLPLLLRRLGIRSLLDIPCGDWYWMQHVDLAEIEYIGADIVEDLVRRNAERHGSPRRSFVVKDLCRDTLPQVDLILCRDCLLHLKLRDGREAIANMKRSGSQYLLTSTFARCVKNEELPASFWRPINLQLPPFSFPQPLELIADSSADAASRSERFLGLWKLAAIP
jgi:hypothetical protein